MESLEQYTGIEQAIDTYWKPFPFISVTLFEAGVSLDASSTFCFMRDLGISAEQNPMVRYLAENMGIIPGLATHVVFNVAVGIGFYSLCKYFGRTVNSAIEPVTQKQNTFNSAYFGYAGLYYLAMGKLECGIENIMLYVT